MSQVQQVTYFGAWLSLELVVTTAPGVRAFGQAIFGPKHSTNAMTVAAGSEADIGAFQNGQFIIRVSVNDVKVEIWGAMESDFSDEVRMSQGTVTADGNFQAYSALSDLVHLRYVRMKIQSAVDDVAGVFEGRYMFT